MYKEITVMIQEPTWSSSDVCLFSFWLLSTIVASLWWLSWRILCRWFKRQRRSGVQFFLLSSFGFSVKRALS